MPSGTWRVRASGTVGVLRVRPWALTHGGGAGVQVMSYAERVQKREQEIAGLKEALAILS